MPFVLTDTQSLSQIMNFPGVTFAAVPVTSTKAFGSAKSASATLDLYGVSERKKRRAIPATATKEKTTAAFRSSISIV